MPPAILILLGLMVVVFIIWVFTMIRILLALKKVSDQRRADEKAGIVRSHVIVTSTFALFMTAPEYRRDKWRIVLLTALLFAIIIGQMLLVPYLGAGP